MIWKTWSHVSSYFLTKPIFSNRIFILCYLILYNQTKSKQNNLYILNIYFIAKLRLTQSSWIQTYFITSISFNTLTNCLSHTHRDTKHKLNILKNTYESWICSIYVGFMIFIFFSLFVRFSIFLFARKHKLSYFIRQSWYFGSFIHFLLIKIVDWLGPNNLVYIKVEIWL